MYQDAPYAPPTPPLERPAPPAELAPPAVLASDDDLARALDAACLAIASQDWSAASQSPDAPRTIEALREAIVAFVRTRRREGHPPERVLIGLREELEGRMWRHGSARVVDMLHDMVFKTFLASYFDDARPR